MRAALKLGAVVVCLAVAGCTTTRTVYVQETPTAASSVSSAAPQAPAQPQVPAARQLGYTWSRWRRKHQARARYHHYQAWLRAAHD
jgi:hypothetical protein